MSEPQIRDALRQLGEAISALVRAVLSTVRRRPPARSREPQGGPPQAWIDLVAETDPEWLARSPWADRVRTGAPASRVEWPRREPDTEAAPEQAREVPVRTTRGGHDRQTWDVRATRHPLSGATQVPGSEATEDRTDVPATNAQPRRRRLLPAQPDTDEVARPDRQGVEGPPPSPRRRLARLFGPQPLERADDDGRTASAPASRHPYGVADVVASPLDVPQVRAPSHLVPPHPANPPHATVTELPGTWVTAPATRSQHVPSSSASQPVWPKLPLTPGLDDTEPAPGLAAALWRLDGQPDPLTTAQRRS